MALEYLSELALNSFISLALSEDIGDGDHTTNSCISSADRSTAKLLVKEDGILAGVNLAERIILKLDPSAEFDLKIKDGQPVKTGDIAFIITANTRAILSGERLILNCMQRMSGIATKTKEYVNLIKHTNTKLLDTRKTTPNFRILEKWAVIIGGGKNHRYNLADMLMIKDNHIDYAGGITKAVTNAQSYLAEKKLDRKIEVEARSFEEVKEIVKCGGVFRILLDNMTPSQIKEALLLIPEGIETEASGNITDTTISKYSETGVDFISVGALTHSIKSLDLSLKAI